MSLFDDFEPEANAGPEVLGEALTEVEFEEAVPSGAVSYYVASISYIGTEFHGVAYQSSQRTVVGVLQLALERSLRCSIEMVVAGRTDAGVHAFGQIVSFSGPTHKAGLDGLYQSISRQLPDDVSLNWIGLTDVEFSARFSAKYRHYLYRLEPGVDSDAVWARRAWQIPNSIDMASMRSASYVLIGEHDFSGFCKKPEVGSHSVRRVLDVRVTERGRFVDFEIWANAFCHQMVRGIVGGLVEVSTGRLSVADFAQMVLGEGTKRRSPAPADGLYLVNVGYEPFKLRPYADPFEVLVGEVPAAVYAISSCLERAGRVGQKSNR